MSKKIQNFKSWLTKLKTKFTLRVKWSDTQKLNNFSILKICFFLNRTMWSISNQTNSLSSTDLNKSTFEFDSRVATFDMKLIPYLFSLFLQLQMTIKKQMKSWVCLKSFYSMSDIQKLKKFLCSFLRQIHYVLVLY